MVAMRRTRRRAVISMVPRRAPALTRVNSRPSQFAPEKIFSPTTPATISAKELTRPKLIL